jgi:SAM-dependent methyltransferase
MDPDTLAAQVVAARAYEEHLVPALFQEWAPRVVEAAGVSLGARVLDVGCGTGILARTARAVVGAEGAVTGLDPSLGMLATAAELEPAVDWREGHAESLPFEAATHDAVLSQFALMFVPDRARAVAEMARVLVPGGRLAVAVFDRLEANPAYAAEVELLRRQLGEPAADALRAPFALGDAAALEGLLSTAAGLRDVRVESRAGTGRFPSARAMVEPDLVGWLPMMGIDVPPEAADRVRTEAREALAGFIHDDGSVVFPTRALLATATRA